jgi:AraC family transcriptional regulator of arabinose operon
VQVLPEGAGRNAGERLPAGAYPGGMHDHPCVEICHLVDGSCRLAYPGGGLPLHTGDSVFIRPGAAHCEAWSRKDQGYALLWIVLLGDECDAFVSRYAGRSGRRSIVRCGTVCSSAVGNVARAVVSLPAESGDISSGVHPELQGELLFLAAELERVVRRPSRTARAGDLARRVKRFLDAHYAERMDLPSVASVFRASPNHLNRIFASHAGCTIHKYLVSRRLSVADHLLRAGGVTVKEVAYRVGFSDPLYFSRAFKARFGVSPGTRRGG